MIELVLTINDKDGSYTEHAGVVLASIFSNTQHTINVHIVHDDTLSGENKLKLTELVDVFHHNIFFYHVTVPGDLQAVAAGVHKIDYWTIASMYRLLLPLIIPADRVIYLDCDILVNTDINELWSIDLGERYLGAVLDQGENLLEYFISLGLNAELYFNSGVILFQLNNIRNKQTWYGEMLDFLRNFPIMTMPDQDVLNAVYSTNYLQMDLRFNTFAHPELDLNNKIVHFAGDNKWWDIDSPAAPLYNKFLAMTPWGRRFTTEPLSEPEQASIPLQPPAPEVPPAEIQLAEIHPTEIHPTGIHPTEIHPTEIHPTEIHPTEIHPTEIHPTGIHPTEIHPAEIHPAEIPILENSVPEVAAPTPENIPVKRHRRKRRRSLRLRLRLRKKRVIRAKYRSIVRVKLIELQYIKKKKALKSRKKKLRLVRKKSKHVIKKVPLKKRRYHKKRTLKRKLKRTS